MKILITGASGFIGSHIAKGLVQDKYTVCLLLRKTSNLRLIESIKKSCGLFYYDGTYQSLEKTLQESKCQIVIHCASLFLSSHAPDDVECLMNSNISFPSMLLEAMANTGVQGFINTGTSWQHYRNEDYNPVNLYASTKQAFEQIISYYLETGKIKQVTLKLFDTYGPDDSRRKLIPLLVNNLSSGERVNMSPGEQEVSIVHVEDVVDAYRLAINEVLNINVGESLTFGVGSGKVYKLKELIEDINNSFENGRSINVFFGGRPYREREVMTVWDKYEAVPGWKESKNIIDFFKSYIKSKYD